MPFEHGAQAEVERTDKTVLRLGSKWSIAFEIGSAALAQRLHTFAQIRSVKTHEFQSQRRIEGWSGQP